MKEEIIKKLLEDKENIKIISDFLFEKIIAGWNENQLVDGLTDLIKNLLKRS
ncbi:MAG: hypothetical protein QXI58_00630 [Candidatus Micrarchaeia archaeon]